MSVNNNNNNTGLLSLLNLKITKDITIPPVHVSLRCDIRLPIWEQYRITQVHPTFLTRAGLSRNLNALKNGVDSL
jgi:hypothetical protein